MREEEREGINVPTIAPPHHILRFFDTYLIAHIDLQQFHFPRQSFLLELFHGGFTLFDGPAAEEDEIFGVVEELGSEGEANTTVGWVYILVGA